MNKESSFRYFREAYARIKVLSNAASLLYHDGVTAAPPGASRSRGPALGVLSELEYRERQDKELIRTVDYLLDHPEQLTPAENREIHEFNRANEFISSIPADEYAAYQVLLSDADAVWHRAKLDNDFAAFRPYLERIFDTNRRFALYYRPACDPYDTLLDMFERGLNCSRADAFFDRLRSHIVPLLARVKTAPPIDDSFVFRHYPVEQQRRFSDILLNSIAVNREYCSIAETEHPFTNNFSRYDVRVTTHYYEDNVVSSMYSVIHEGGHALYELGSGEEYEGTCLAGGVSMGIHESQSRLFENIIGRSREYIELIFPEMQRLFPEQLADVDARRMWLAVNKSQPSLIRTEADELTYALHIMVRYELERELIAGKLSVAELPDAWGDKYYKYLGINVPDDTHGVLQDSHWSGGSIGYFPSYALGSAYGAHIMAVMRRELDVDSIIRSGRISEIVAWLTQRIYRHSCRYDPDELLTMCLGEPFDPTYFTDYLEDKYKNIMAECRK